MFLVKDMWSSLSKAENQSRILSQDYTETYFNKSTVVSKQKCIDYT